MHKNMPTRCNIGKSKNPAGFFLCNSLYPCFGVLNFQKYTALFQGARTFEQTIELYIAIAVAIAFACTNVPLSSSRLPTSFIHPLYFMPKFLQLVRLVSTICLHNLELLMLINTLEHFLINF